MRQKYGTVTVGIKNTNQKLIISMRKKENRKEEGEEGRNEVKKKNGNKQNKIKLIVLSLLEGGKRNI